MTELWHKYVDFSWAKDFQLEKLSICEMGLKNVFKHGKKVGTGFREVASVPLPGATTVSTGPELEGETYVPPPKREKWAWRNTPRDHNYRQPSKCVYPPETL